MGFDVIEVHGAGDTGKLIDIADVAGQVCEVLQPLAVQLEVISIVKMAL